MSDPDLIARLRAWRDWHGNPCAMLREAADALEASDADTVQLPRLTEGMMRAACQAHYRNDNIDGISLTASDCDYNFRQGFKRMWSGVRKHLAAAHPKPDEYCRVCSALITSAELCDECAPGNDPLLQSKYGESRT